MKGTVFFTADCHLEKRLRNASLFAEDSYQAFEKMVDRILTTEGPTALVIAGDLLEHPYIGGRSLDVLKAQFTRLFDKGVRILSIMGNHDNQPVSIPVTQGAEDLNGEVLDVCGLKIGGINYTPPEILRGKLEELPAMDILVLHQAFQHLLGFEGSYDLSVNLIPERVKNVVSGDIHVTDVLDMGKGRKFVSPGTLHPNKVDENGDHGFFRLDDKGWEYLTIPTRPIYRYTVETGEELAGVRKEVKAGDVTPVLELKYPRDLDYKVKEFAKAAGDGIYFIPKPWNPDEQFKETGDKEDITMAECLPSVVDKDKKPALYSFIRRLLTEDFKGVVNDKVKEYEVELEGG